MKIKFWGTRGSIPSPGPLTTKYGGNTPCVEVVSNNGDHIIIDCGSGMRLLGNEIVGAKKSVKANILLSHTHWDHIQGFPFFKPGFIPGNEFVLYGPQDTGSRIQKVLEGQMEHRYFPVTLKMMGSKITFRELKEEEFSIGDLDVKVHYMNHTSLTLGFRISGDGVVFCYCTDTEPHSLLRESQGGRRNGLQNFVHVGDKMLVDFVRGADFLIIDAQYNIEEYENKKGWGHSPVEYVVDVGLLGEVKTLALFHHDPEHPDAVLDDFEVLCRERIASLSKNMEVCVASEGLEIELKK